MANSKIEWTDKVWNPITGCTPISRGCDNCYAKKFATRLRGRCGYDSENPFKITYHPNRLLEPLTWKKPQKVFVGSMGDIFHNDVSFEYIDSVFSIMSDNDKHTYFILTKRPKNILAFFVWKRMKSFGINWRAKNNIYFGVSAENQEQADKRIPILMDIPAAVRFISCEPLLGPITISKDAFKDNMQNTGGPINWIIAGGENGQKARPCHTDWIRSLKDQAKNNGIPFFFKGWGNWSNNIPDQIQLPSSSWAYVCPSTAHVSYGISQDMDYNKSYDLFAKVGKSKSGNLIDGKMYQEFPQI